MDDIPVLLPALRGDKYKTVLCLFVWGGELCGKLFHFFVKPQKSLRAKNWIKKGVFPGKKTTGLATGTTAQITACKKLAHRPSSEKRICMLGDNTFWLWHSEYSASNVCLWNTTQKSNSCGLTTDLSFNEGDMQYYFEDICHPTIQY